MHLGDSIFIFILALVLFGPKKLPEMAKQIGKLMAEFRRASNDFRIQIDEELRTMERQEQQKKQEAERAALAASTSSPEPSILPPAALTAGDSMASAGSSVVASEPGTLQIMPPTLGEQVSAGTPYAVSATSDTLQPAEDHPLLRVESIPVDLNDPHANGSAPTGLAAAEANAATLPAQAPHSAPSEPEPEQAPVHNG